MSFDDPQPRAVPTQATPVPDTVSAPPLSDDSQGTIREAGLTSVDRPVSLDQRPTVPDIKTAPADDAWEAGRAFGPYQLLGEIAHGGMGIVYKARDPKLDRTVALKMLRAGAFADTEEIQRFYNEARAAAKLHHPNIVDIHEVGQHEGRHFFTMAYEPGGSLAQHLKRFAADPRAAVALMEKVARAVHHAHQNGILHRDLKPANVLLNGQGEPLVSDFGLAKLTDSQVDLTQPGAQLGTPAYMAPEQAAGENDRVSAHSDVWSLGVLLYELLTGRRPFTSLKRDELSSEIRTSDPPPPRSLSRRLDRNLETIVLKCLEKDPARRYDSAGALADDLARWLKGEPILARPASWPRRLGRFLRRHRVLTATAVLGLLTAAAIPLVQYYQYLRDPERILEGYRKDLSKGETVTLIGATGPPRVQRWAVAEGAARRSEAGDGAFCISSFATPSVLELFPNPGQPRFRYQVQIRHDEATKDDGGHVGIVFGYRKHELPTGVVHCYLDLVFADKGRAAKSFVRDEDIDRTTGQPKEDAKWGSKAIISVRCAFEPVDGKSTGSRGQLAVSTFFTPARDGHAPDDWGNRVGPWRDLAVEVTPEAIEVFWNNQPFKKISRAEVVKAATSWLKGTGLDPETAVGFDGSLGLYVSRSAGSFRNAVVIPRK